MDMIQAVRSAQAVYKRYGHQRILMVRPASYSGQKATAQSWYIMGGEGGTDFLLEAFLHPDGYLLTVTGYRMPSPDEIVSDWESQRCPLNEDKIINITKRSMMALKDALHFDSPLPCLQTETLEPAIPLTEVMQTA
jgi:hypothetical protein